MIGQNTFELDKMRMGNCLQQSYTSTAAKLFAYLMQPAIIGASFVLWDLISGMMLLFVGWMGHVMHKVCLRSVAMMV